MPIDLIQVPYDSAQRGVRMGRGPVALAEAGAAGRLREAAGAVREVVVEARPDFRAEVATAFELCRSVALAVRGARGRGSFPILMSGNCLSSLGALAALDPAETGIAWFDAHGDLNTPETSASGFLDGMALATMVGRCWRTLAGSVDGFTAVPEERVILVGVRDLDEGEERLLEGSRMMRVGWEQVRERGAPGALDARLEALAGRVRRVYLHVDLDVHDPAHARANGFAVPGGLTPGEVRNAIRAIASRVEIVGAAVTAYDPDFDEGGRMRDVALELLELFAELAPRGDEEDGES
jgi:arginase